MSRQYYKKLSDLLLGGGSAVQATVVSGTRAGAVASCQKAMLSDGEVTTSQQELMGFWKSIFQKSEKEKLPAMVEHEGYQVLMERISSRQKLVICGGGHIAHPLAQMGAMLDFDVTVIDDREEFANAQRFPMAKEIYCESFESAFEKISDTENTYYVIITRGHKDDRLCLSKILNRRFAYVGMIGSRKKVAIVMEQLEKEGYSKETLSQVYAPIGLRIGAQTPAEIAVCIAAQIIQVRSGASDGSIPAAALAKLSQGVPMMLATILKKTGSSPRGVGTKLLMDEQGTLYGTIGGGAGEAAVIAAAADVLKSKQPRIMECNMTSKNALDDGMVCGGDIKVLLDPIFPE